MQGHLLKSTENTCMVDNKMLFNDLCARSRVRIVDDEARYVIEELYSIGIALHSLQDVLKWKERIKSIRYGSITKLNKYSVRRRYENLIGYRSLLISLACEEIKIIKGLIEASIHKHNKVLMNAKEMNIHLLEQAYDNIDRNVGYIRKMIVKVPYIIKNLFEKCYGKCP